MIHIKNTARDLLRLGFTGYRFIGNPTYAAQWIEERFNPDDYWQLEGITIFVRNLTAETMLRLAFHDRILDTVVMQRNGQLKVKENRIV